MNKKVFAVLLLCMACSAAFAQTADTTAQYKDGYALKGRDTIWCRVWFSSKHNHPFSSVRLLVNGDEINFAAGNIITGFGAEEDGVKYHYGTVVVESGAGQAAHTHTLFIRKTVAGTIDFYEYTYSFTTVKTSSVVGDIKTNAKTSTSTQTYTDYYIAKTDSAAPSLATAVMLNAFRKKDLEKYLNDNPALLADLEKRLNLKELVALLNKYNNWSLKQRKPQ